MKEKEKWNPEEVRRFRAAYNLTQKEMGVMLGVCEKYIYHLEKGSRKPSKTLQLLLDYVSKEMQMKGGENAKGDLQTKG